jgi:hypothetical protein
MQKNPKIQPATGLHRFSFSVKAESREKHLSLTKAFAAPQGVFASINAAQILLKSYRRRKAPIHAQTMNLTARKIDCI